MRCSKKLTKEQFDFSEANGFTDELITIVADEGWDKVDIENFVLMYNFQNGKHVALPIFDRDKMIYGKRGKEDRSMPKDKNLAKKVIKIRKIKSAKMKAQKIMVRQGNQELVGKHAVVKRK